MDNNARDRKTHSCYRPILTPPPKKGSIHLNKRHICFPSDLKASCVSHFLHHPTRFVLNILNSLLCFMLLVFFTNEHYAIICHFSFHLIGFQLHLHCKKSFTRQDNKICFVKILTLLTIL